MTAKPPLRHEEVQRILGLPEPLSVDRSIDFEGSARAVQRTASLLGARTRASACATCITDHTNVAQAAMAAEM
jgi:hypothetical protein